MAGVVIHDAPEYKVTRAIWRSLVAGWGKVPHTAPYCIPGYGLDITVFPKPSVIPK